MKRDTFAEGYRSFSGIAGAAQGVFQAEAYVGRIAEAYDALERNLNAFKGFETDIRQLKGDIQEFRASGTFNIRAALADTSFRTTVDRSHGYASADITTNWGEEYGLKALFSGTASAKAQSISQFQRFAQYKAISGRTDLTFDAFLAEKGLDPSHVMASDPIYRGQMRLIPSDQLEEAIAFLKRQIARKEFTNPEEVNRYQETLQKLTAQIMAPDGTASDTATTQDLLDLAEKAKRGTYSAAEEGYSAAQLVEMEHVLHQGIKAGLTAATITLVLKCAPAIYQCLDELIASGRVDEEKLKAIGFAALDGTTEGFVRGFISATLTTGCTAGLWGETLRQVSPEAIGASVVIVMNTLKDAFLLAKGTLSNNEFAYNLQRNLFVTSCGLGGGALLQAVLPTMPFAYLLGSFVGSMVGSFAFVAYDRAILSFCITSGCTFFGIVGQDYRLPDKVMEDLGISLFDYEQSFPSEAQYSSFTPHLYVPHEYKPSMISILRRGVIGVRQIGYATSQ